MTTTEYAPTVLKVLTKYNSQTVIPSEIIVDRIVKLAEAISEKRLFVYQKEFGTRLVTAILEHNGDILTALWSRQSGKSECIAAFILACMIILPVLARMKEFENDWRFNCTDEQGNYRGYKKGLKVGIYAPRQKQANIAYSRIKDNVNSDTCGLITDELGIHVQISNGNMFWMSNGSKIQSYSASEQSKIEGDSYHVLILDEAQDIGTMQVRKSLHPMVAAYNGVIVKIGTCSVQKSDFYTEIKKNERDFMVGGVQNHFFFNYHICIQSNSFYRDFVNKEKERLGEESDEFRLSYDCEWLLERGQFCTKEQMLKCMRTTGPFSELWNLPDPRSKTLFINGNLILNRHNTLVAGIDFGKVHDSTVVTVMYVDWKNPEKDEYVVTPEGCTHFQAYRKYVVGWLVLHGDDYPQQFEKITDFLNIFKGLRKIVLDSTGVGTWGLDQFRVYYANFNRGISLATHEQEKGYVEVEGFNFSQSSKSEGYKLLQTDMLGGRLFVPAGEHTEQLRTYKRFLLEMMDLRKTYTNSYMACEAPDEPGAHDDFPCFPAGAPVLTACGITGIDCVKAGMSVMTRHGWKVVRAAFKSGVKSLYRIGNIVGTREHPVWCVNKNMYVTLDSLMLDDTVLEWKNTQLSLTVCALIATRSQKEDSTDCTTGHIRSGSAHRFLCTGIFGKKYTEKLLKVLSYITKIITEPIINSPIYSACHEAITPVCTPESHHESQQPANQSKKHSSHQHAWIGYVQRKVERLRAYVLPFSGPKHYIDALCAKCAGKGSAQEIQDKHSLVPTLVRHVAGDKETLQRYESMQPNEKVNVYNLDVCSTPEFVCQGLLVHNCSLMLANWAAQTPASSGTIEKTTGNWFVNRVD